MEKKYCPICNGEILFSYITPEKTYTIEDGKIIREDNNLNDVPYLEFYCSNDKEHDIDTGEIFEWSDQVETDFYQNGSYDI